MQDTIQLGPFERVPSGSDDESVKAYYDYLQMQELLRFNETYFWNPILFAWVDGVTGVLLLLFYFFVGAWWVSVYFLEPGIR